MKSISLYEEKGSLLNKMAPESKILYIVVALLLPAIMGSKWISVGFIVISACLLLISKVLKKTVPILSISGFVLLTVVIIQGIFRAGNVTPVFSIGPISFYKEGLGFALGIVINVLNILLSFCVLILTAKPSDIVENFVRKGFSPRFGYVFISVFQIIPQMTETMSTITDAQRSRGMETEGNLLVRIKAFLPLISPVVMSSLINTKERALALEVRGFNAKNKKTFINDEKKCGADRYIQIGMLILLVAGIVWRVAGWQ
ncbi:energy-coupling factor transporter transmembrane component T [Kineothrix sedimenti]|uniref:Energy-coupling factor transporter transmembrane component T n=1 Tax=Kineothrix sedimenti TaxID=3123317 RepID=A0ABZ3ET95_9FIRM